MFTDYIPPSPGSDASDNFFNNIYDSQKDFLVHQISDSFVTNFNEDKHVTIVDIHSSFLGGTKSERESIPVVHPELEPVLHKCSAIIGKEEDQLIEYVDAYPDRSKTNLYSDLFQLSSCSSKLLTKNVNINNSNGAHKIKKMAMTGNIEDLTAKVQDLGQAVANIKDPIATNHYVGQTVLSSTSSKAIKKKKSLIEKFNSSFFGKKKSSMKSAGSVAFSNKISPVPSHTDAADADMEEILTVEKDLDQEREDKEEINQYTVDDFTAKDERFSEFQSDTQPVLQSSGIFCQQVSEVDDSDLTRPKDLNGRRPVATNYKSVPNMKFRKSSTLPASSRTMSNVSDIRASQDDQMYKSENYLASLNNSGNLSPFIRVIAEKYNLFQERENQPCALLEASYLPRYTPVDRVSDDFVSSPYVEGLFGKISPGSEEHKKLKRKRKSPSVNSSQVAKKRPNTNDEEDQAAAPCYKKLLLTEKEFVSDFVENILDDVVLELREEEVGKFTTKHDPFSHHKEEFDQIREKFETGRFNESSQKEPCLTRIDRQQKCFAFPPPYFTTVPTLARLCNEVLDNYEKKFMANWKKKYLVSSYTPQGSKREGTYFTDYDTLSCPSLGAGKSDIYEPYWDGKLSLTGDSLSEASFSRGIDSYSLDQPSFETDQKKGPWVSPAPPRRDLASHILKDPQNISTLSCCSDIGTQTTELDSYYEELLNLSGNKRPLMTRNASTSPVQELLLADLSMEDNKSYNSASPQNSPRVSSKPRYSSSPIYNVCSDGGLLDDKLNVLKTKTKDAEKRTESLPKHYRNKSHSELSCYSAHKTSAHNSETSFHNHSRVQRSHTIDYNSDIAKSLMEKRKKRFTFKHLLNREDKNPVRLLSFRKLSCADTDSETNKNDNRNIVDTAPCRIVKLAESPKKSRNQMHSNHDHGNQENHGKNKNDTECMLACFPHSDFSTNDTFFNRSSGEDSIESDVSTPPATLDHFGHWKVYYDNTQPYFAFEEIGVKRRRFEFCETDNNFVSCSGAKRSPVHKEQGNIHSFQKDENIDENISGPGCMFHFYGEETEGDLMEQKNLDAETGHEYSIDSLAQSDDNRGPYPYPENPVPGNDYSQDFDYSEEVVEDELSPDSFSFMQSLARQMKQINLADTPKADDDGGNLNDFLQEALKPLDDLLSEDSCTEEDLSITQMSSSRWRCTASDYPSFVSFREDDVSFVSDEVCDSYPEPDDESQYSTLKNQKNLQDEISVQSKLEEYGMTPNNSVASFAEKKDVERKNSEIDEAETLEKETYGELCSPKLMKPTLDTRTKPETLEGWLNFNEVVSDYTAPVRKERYPTFTFLTPHKIEHASSNSPENILTSGSQSPTTPHKIEHSSTDTPVDPQTSGSQSPTTPHKVEPASSYSSEDPQTPCSPRPTTSSEDVFTTPGTHVFNSPNTCNNTFVSLSEVSFNGSRGCTPYFTDVDGTLLEDPVMANTNNNEPEADATDIQKTLFTNVADVTVEDSFNDEEVDTVLVVVSEDDAIDV